MGALQPSENALCDLAELAWLTALHGSVTVQTFASRICPRLSKKSAERRWHRLLVQLRNG